MDRILKQIQERMLTQKQASRHLGRSAQQIRRLTKRIALSRTNAIISKHTGVTELLLMMLKKIF